MYVGRLARDKGVVDLARAVSALQGLHLVLVGPDEDGLRAELDFLTGKISFIGYSAAPERWFAAADIACLPSHREGFGVALIEAGACGVPVLASRIYGTRDAVLEDKTGLLHEAGDVADLREKLARLVADPELRRRLGEGGRQRAEAEFRQDRQVQALLDYYSRL
jgi:glycosyltransferase involved in cell wall biosynthesis